MLEGEGGRTGIVRMEWVGLAERGLVLGGGEVDYLSMLGCGRYYARTRSAATGVRRPLNSCLAMTSAGS